MSESRLKSHFLNRAERLISGTRAEFMVDRYSPVFIVQRETIVKLSRPYPGMVGQFFGNQSSDATQASMETVAADQGRFLTLGVSASLDLYGDGAVIAVMNQTESTAEEIHLVLKCHDEKAIMVSQGAIVRPADFIDGAILRMELDNTSPIYEDRRSACEVVLVSGEEAVLELAHRTRGDSGARLGTVSYTPDNLTWTQERNKPISLRATDQAIFLKEREPRDLQEMGNVIGFPPIVIQQAPTRIQDIATHIKISCWQNGEAPLAVSLAA